MADDLGKAINEWAKANKEYTDANAKATKIARDLADDPSNEGLRNRLGKAEERLRKAKDAKDAADKKLARALREIADRIKEAFDRIARALTR